MTTEIRPTFAQREGGNQIPEQLKPGEVSQQLRAMLWGAVYRDFEKCVSSDWVWHHWKEILADYHLEVLHRMPTAFSQASGGHRALMAHIFTDGDYVAVLDFTEWLLRNAKVPKGVKSELVRALVVARSAYRVVDGDTVVAISGEHEAAALAGAFDATAGDRFAGVRAHLKAAAKELRDGRAAPSIRESIHAVEAVVAVLEPDAGGFASALGKLEARLKMHGALKAGFTKLYGFTSDEKGIRHSLGDIAEADVEETDAIYMLGTCASFVTYLISKSRVEK